MCAQTPQPFAFDFRGTLKVNRIRNASTTWVRKRMTSVSGLENAQIRVIYSIRMHRNQHEARRRACRPPHTIRCHQSVILVSDNHPCAEEELNSHRASLLSDIRFSCTRSTHHRNNSQRRRKRNNSELPGEFNFLTMRLSF